jgi:hypothetical protein
MRWGGVATIGGVGGSQPGVTLAFAVQEVVMVANLPHVHATFCLGSTANAVTQSALFMLDSGVTGLGL